MKQNVDLLNKYAILSIRSAVSTEIGVRMIPLRELSDEEVQMQLRDKVWALVLENDMTIEKAAKEMRLAQSTLYQFVAMKRKGVRLTTIGRILKWIAKKEKLAAEKEKEQGHEQ